MNAPESRVERKKGVARPLWGLLDYLTQLFSWCFVVIVLLLFYVYGKVNGLVAFWMSTTTISVVYHLVREANEVWKIYPLWIDVERRSAIHQIASTPILISGILLASVMFVRGDYYRSAASLLFLLLVDQSIAFSVQRRGEEIFRAFFYHSEEDQKSEKNVTGVSLELNHPQPLLENSSAFLNNNDSFSNELGDSEIELMNIVRTRTEGREQIYGNATIEFEPGSDVMFLNVSFCPPFAGVPSLDFEQTDGEDYSITTSLLQSFGARLEIRRSSSVDRAPREENDGGKIEFYAVYPPLENERS